MAEKQSRGRRYGPCPVSAGVLSQMHWDKRMSLREMGINLGEFYADSPAVSVERVRLWMIELGVERRSSKAAVKIYMQKNPEALKAFGDAGKAGFKKAAAEGRIGNTEQLLKHHKKGVRAAVKKRQEQAKVTMVCSQCSKTFERLRHRTQEGQEHYFCGHSCRQKWFAKMINPANWISFRCAECGERTARLRSGMKSDDPSLWFCSRSCGKRNYHKRNREAKASEQKSSEEKPAVR